MRHAGLLVVAGALAAAAPARADGGVPRYQVVAADVAADATIALGVHLESPTVSGWGVAAYLLVAPAIHLVHGDGGDAARSLGLRLVAPVGGAFAGGLVGLAAGSGKDALATGFGGLVVGAVLGTLAVELYDVAVLAGPAEAAAAPRVVSFGGQF
ncbi:MAG: hypothetical protein JNK64_00810 [Myxococcales bacterium]|nr:hypothetical protein [Myxococcales bacterium]